MSYVWEQEYLPLSDTAWDFEWHLKKVWDKDPMAGMFAVPIMGNSNQSRLPTTTRPSGL